MPGTVCQTDSGTIAGHCLQIRACCSEGCVTVHRGLSRLSWYDADTLILFASVSSGHEGLIPGRTTRTALFGIAISEAWSGCLVPCCLPSGTTESSGLIFWRSKDKFLWVTLRLTSCLFSPIPGGYFSSRNKHTWGLIYIPYYPRSTLEKKKLAVWYSNLRAVSYPNFSSLIPLEHRQLTVIPPCARFMARPESHILQLSKEGKPEDERLSLVHHIHSIALSHVC